MDRIDTSDELSALLNVVQQVGARLEQQTQGYLHHHARELCELLAQARRRLDLIKAESRAPVRSEEAPKEKTVQYRPRPF